MTTETAIPPLLKTLEPKPDELVQACEHARAELAEIYSSSIRDREDESRRNKLARAVILRTIDTIERSRFQAPQWVAEARRRFELVLRSVGLSTH